MSPREPPRTAESIRKHQKIFENQRKPPKATEILENFRRNNFRKLTTQTQRNTEQLRKTLNIAKAKQRNKNTERYREPPTTYEKSQNIDDTFNRKTPNPPPKTTENKRKSPLGASGTAQDPREPPKTSEDQRRPPKTSENRQERTKRR